jgi:hypothetical protein
MADATTVITNDTMDIFLAVIRHGIVAPSSEV